MQPVPPVGGASASASVTAAARQEALLDEENQKRAVFLAQQIATLEKKIELADRVCLDVDRSDICKRREATRIASLGLNQPVSILTMEFGFNPSQRESTESWLAKVAADPGQYQDVVDGLKHLLVSMENRSAMSTA